MMLLQDEEDSSAVPPTFAASRSYDASVTKKLLEVFPEACRWAALVAVLHALKDSATTPSVPATELCALFHTRLWSRDGGLRPVSYPG